jgi:hypothetical protein
MSALWGHGKARGLILLRFDPMCNKTALCFFEASRETRNGRQSISGCHEALAAARHFYALFLQLFKFV